MASVDVVIPVYNEEHVLARSVDTLRASLRDGLPHAWRIVIADNASTDGTLAVAYTQLIPILVEAMKEQSREIAELRAAVEELRAE